MILCRCGFVFALLTLLYKYFSVNLYKEYSYLKLRDLEEFPCFGVMIWQPSQLLSSTLFAYLDNPMTQMYKNIAVKKKIPKSSF